MSKINDQNEQAENKNYGKGNVLKIIMLIGAVLIMAVVLVNNIVTARTPVINDSAGESTTLGFSPSFSCCARNQSQLAAEAIGQEALAYYKLTFGEEADTAAVEDYGCHQEVVILKEGQPIRRLSYNGGAFSDLGPITNETGS